MHEKIKFNILYPWCMFKKKIWRIVIILEAFNFEIGSFYGKFRVQNHYGLKTFCPVEILLHEDIDYIVIKFSVYGVNLKKNLIKTFFFSNIFSWHLPHFYNSRISHSNRLFFYLYPKKFWFLMSKHILNSGHHKALKILS